MMKYLHGKGRMLIILCVTYQDCEAIVYMNQNSINPTEHQYSHNPTETLLPSFLSVIVHPSWVSQAPRELSLVGDNMNAKLSQM